MGGLFHGGGVGNTGPFCLRLEREKPAGGGLLRRSGHFRAPWLQTAGALWLWLLAFLFVWWTFRPPHIGLFLDPVTGQYGIA